LCTELEDPETPVLTEVRDLIFRVVIRPETVFQSQTRILWTDVVDNVLRVGFYNLATRQAPNLRTKHLANPLGVIEQSNINLQRPWNTCCVFQRRIVTIKCRTEMIECRRADSGVPIPILPRSQRVLIFYPTHISIITPSETQQIRRTVSTETKS
jgi:hypothetical protein